MRRWLTLWLEDRRRARAATHVGPTPPSAPVNLNGVDSGTFIGLNWQDTSGVSPGFHVYRNADSAGYVLYQTIGPNVTTTQDSAVTSGHSYRYYVTAFNGVGESGPSNEVFIVFGS